MSTWWGVENDEWIMTPSFIGCHSCTDSFSHVLETVRINHKQQSDERCHFPAPIKASQIPSDEAMTQSWLHSVCSVVFLPSICITLPANGTLRCNGVERRRQRRQFDQTQQVIAITPNQPQNVNYRTARIGKYVLQPYLHTEPSCCHSHASHFPSQYAPHRCQHLPEATPGERGTIDSSICIVSICKLVSVPIFRFYSSVLHLRLVLLFVIACRQQAAPKPLL